MGAGGFRRSKSIAAAAQATPLAAIAAASDDADPGTCNRPAFVKTPDC